MDEVNGEMTLSASQIQVNEYQAIATIIRSLVELIYNRDLGAELKKKVEDKISMIIDKIK